MAITPKPAGSISPPNNLTQEAAGAVAIPNNLTAETQGSVAVPNNLTAKAQGSVAIPNNLTAESQGSVAIPNTLTAEAAGTVAIPNSLTAVAAAVMPRTLCPLLGLDFADNVYSQCGNPGTIDSLLTYSRASSATFVNRRVNGCTGRYEYFVDTDFVGTVTNLVTYSEQLDNVAWSKQNSTVAANTSLAPNDTRTADSFIASAGSFAPNVNDTIAVNSSTTYTISRSVKKTDSVDIVQIFFGSGDVSGNPAVNFNLSTGTIGGTTSAVIASIESEGNGWYKISVTIDTLDTSLQHYIAMMKSMSDTRAQPNTWLGGETLYTWGAQLTESAKPQPYVQTLASSAANTFSESVRREYDAATGESLGALIEGASTNTMLHSEDATNAAYVKTNIATTAGANTIKAPDGTTSGDKITENTATGVHQLLQTQSLTSGNNYTWSAYIKAGERGLVQIRAGNTGVLPANIIFNVANGTVSTTTLGTPSIKSMGDGWYRCTVTATALSTTSTSMVVGLIESGATESYTGDGSSGAFVWGMQAEQLPFASSYIRTEGSTVSRVADFINANYVGNVPEANEKLAITAEFDFIGNPNETRMVWSTNHGTAFQLRTLTNTIRYYRNGIADANGGTVLGSVNYKSTCTWGGGSSGNLYLDGVASSANEIQTGANATLFYIGNSFNANHLFGHMKSIRVYDVALTATEVGLL